MSRPVSEHEERAANAGFACNTADTKPGAHPGDESSEHAGTPRRVASTKHDQTIPTRIMGFAVRALLPVLVIGGGTLITVQLMRTAPKAQQEPPQGSAALVETRSVQRGTHRVVVEAMGTVIAAQEIVVQPQVSGIVTERHAALVPGGHVEAGEVLLVIDDAEYQVAVDQAMATLRRNEAMLQFANWEVERLQALKARQAVHRKEMDDSLTARAVAEADVAAGRAAVERAHIDLARTTVRAPFGGVITRESVDLGALVTPQMQLATLVGTDRYWVRVSVPIDRLAWVNIPTVEGEVGSEVVVTQRLGAGVTAQWTGHVVRLLGDLETQGRMARLLLAVPNPLEPSSGSSVHTPLLIGSYVDVSMTGRELHNVVTVARDEVRNYTNVWLFGADDRLEVRPVRVAFRGRDHVLVEEGLEVGDRLVVTDLSTPVEGMLLRVASVPPGVLSTDADTVAADEEVTP